MWTAMAVYGTRLCSTAHHREQRLISKRSQDSQSLKHTAKNNYLHSIKSPHILNLYKGLRLVSPDHSFISTHQTTVPIALTASNASTYSLQFSTRK